MFFEIKKTLEKEYFKKAVLMPTKYNINNWLSCLSDNISIWARQQRKDDDEHLKILFFSREDNLQQHQQIAEDYINMHVIPNGMHIYELPGNRFVLYEGTLNYDKLLQIFSLMQIELSQRDYLTNCFTRAIGIKKIKELEKTNEKISIVLFDIDHFKRINDKFGHNCGDYVLKEIASIVINNTRKEKDIPVRWGGEEFLIVGSMNREYAYNFSERIRKLIEQKMFVFEGIHLKVTISSGVSVSNNFETALSLADEYLYQAKRNGRNRVVC